ncbi:mycothione reductase [Arthrobacter sp. CAN_C5]|uniref:mycothione reductase n=1 Tax=Arthrobacter sp. CAN_C5 TaxID=2760706 RepID=UPI001AE9FC12|nr:mycothione reductase [Arthrobacter sp. CAN_C5]MBP2217424.1 mycothione reductase [Arthrobacter sp. CAN_C5]
MTHYDLVIVGSGSGNSLITPDWDDRKVAIIDGGTFGGTCLNVGCIPTKMFVYPAEQATDAREASRLGVDLELRDVHWRAIRDRIFTRIDAISQAGRNYRAEELENVTLYEDYVRFTGDKSFVTDAGEEIHADQVVIATGSRAVLPDIPGITLPQVHTSDTIMRLEELPARILILGGGYVAAEFAHIFGAFGSAVTVVNRSGSLLRSLDDSVSEAFTAEASRQWDVVLNHTVASLTANDDGSVRAVLTGDDDDRVLDVDVVLVAAGREPNTGRLAAADAGLDLEADGRLVVDSHQRVLRDGVPVDGVWALGDVSNRFQLKHVANHEARIVAHNVAHPDDLRSSDHRFVPAAVFTHPQIAVVGLTEAEALAKAEAEGFEVTVAVQQYGSTAYGWAMEDTTGFVKLIADQRTGHLLGAHIMGHEASMIIQPLIQAMSFGLDAQTMASGQYWVHPALTEVVENALLSLKAG